MQLLPSSSAAYSELLVVAAAPAEPGVPAKPHRFLWIEPLTGEILHQESAPDGTRVVSIMPLPRRGNPQQTVLPFLFIDSEKKVHMMPSTPSKELATFVEATTDRLFHYEVDPVGQVVQGFKLEPES